MHRAWHDKVNHRGHAGEVLQQHAGGLKEISRAAAVWDPS